MHSIRVKITAMTIIAILTSILSVIGASYYTVETENGRSSAEMMHLLSENAKKSLDEYLESVESSVELAANVASDALDGVKLVENGAAGAFARQNVQTPEQARRLDEYLVSYCDSVQPTLGSVADHTHGVVCYYLFFTPEISREAQGFYYARLGKAGFEAREPLDVGLLDPEDHTHNDWYFLTVQRGRPSWIGPYPERTTGETSTVSYVTPIYKAGALVGVLGMDIEIDTFISLIKPIQVYDTGFAALYDESGKVLYHPELAAGSTPELTDRSVHERMLSEQTSGAELIRYNAKGGKRQMSFSTLSNGMKIVVTAPVSEITASWRQLTKIIFLVAAAIIGVFVVIVALAMRLLTGPLQRLTSASQRLAAGDYDVELKYEGRDEVGILTRAFIKMRDHLKRYISDLNRRINTDDLTGLPSMPRFFELAEAERGRMKAAGKRPAFLYFNLIGMKNFNRQFGFSEGDQLIRAIAKVIAGQFGGINCSRFSQDHFAVVTDAEGVEEKLKAVFEQCLSANGGNTLPIHAGIYLDQAEQVEVSAACDRATYACDQHRESYLSNFYYFDQGMLEQTEHARYIINNLDRALSEGWIKVYYQPIIRSANGKVCDEEALSRWIDPEKGMISPGEFIPVLENSKLIYKLDLFVVDQVLQKMKRQAENGLYVVPESVNLSRADFDSRDMVEEICRRVDAAGIERSKLTIEITESVVGSDFDFMKAQVERFQKSGFEVWMDDFGSGYSSLDVLQSIHFDQIKFDMRFMEQFGNGDEGKIILTELVRMAMGLGVGTVCEGVENEEQVTFLQEIGCTKMQGFYYCKPIPPEEIIRRNEQGIQIGFENPDESEYYTSIGRINLYDMAVIASEDAESFRRYFDTLPMAIIEVNGTKAKYVRCNKSYRDFMQHTFGMMFSNQVLDCAEMPAGPGSSFMNTVLRCAREGTRAIVDETVDANTTIHSFVRRVAANPVTGTVAVAIAVLAIMEEQDAAGTTYAHIARALSADYMNLYYVDLETEQFIEYTSDPSRDDLAVKRRGEHFFSASREDAKQMLVKEDSAFFIDAFTKENLLRSMDEHGTFTITYRLLIDGNPTYVSMKAVRMQTDKKHIIIGVSNVDAQMRQKEALARIQAEQSTFARITALSGDYIVIYTIDPETERYYEYSATQAYTEIGLATQGENFFAQARKESLRALFPEDVERFNAMFTRENVMREIEQNGMFALNYRLVIDGEPKYVSAKAVLIKEQDTTQLIIGVSNIDAQVRREQDYERKLSAARSRANLDELTGVKNMNAYLNMSESLTKQIEEGQPVRYAIVLCRVSGLGHVTEMGGKEAGDQLICQACAIICNVFKHSPVFRVANDEFAVITQRHDYEVIDELHAEIQRKNEDGSMPNGTAVVCGVAAYNGSESVASVFERAESFVKEIGKDAVSKEERE